MSFIRTEYTLPSGEKQSGIVNTNYITHASTIKRGVPIIGEPQKEITEIRLKGGDIVVTDQPLNELYESIYE